MAPARRRRGTASSAGTGNGGLGGGAGANAGSAGGRRPRGYATAGNNTGHEGDSSYALDHPEKIKDFGYRSTHEMTVTSKALIKAFYGKEPRVSYMAEGGGGTIAALSSAQRYPEDYDTIAVTGMSSYLTRHTFGADVVLAGHAQGRGAASSRPTSMRCCTTRALAACDALDGLKDGVIGDVRALQVRSGDAPVQGRRRARRASRAPQVEAARKIYAGPTNPRTGEEIYSPMYPGQRTGLGTAGRRRPAARHPGRVLQVLRLPRSDLGLQDAAGQLRQRRGARRTGRRSSRSTRSIPICGRFFARGGKLLLVDGWNDTAVPPKVAINYYNAVVAKMGAKTVSDSMRFFMVPGHGPRPGHDRRRELQLRCPRR